MKNKQLHKSFCYIVLTLLLLIVSVIGGGFIVPAFADTREYTDVLDDLSKDKSFVVGHYPAISGNYSLQVIQIAESEDGELFIYTYQPMGKLAVATSINISTTLYESLHYENYELELLNFNGTLYKYKVADFEVKKSVVRYYDISSIYRAWNKDLDGEPENDNTVSEKAFAVGQLWTVTNFADGVAYDCQDVEVVKVTSQMVGIRRYKDGLEWSGIEFCDAHYIAFSCDHEIDRLLSADIGFYTQSYELSSGKGKLGNDKQKQYKTVTSLDKGESKKETWQRLSSTTEFINDKEISGKEKETLSNYDWIINFYETEYSMNNKWENVLTPVLLVNEILSLINGADISHLYNISGTLVSDVTIMRLEFEYGGKIYNLGVVSDKQTGSFKPSNSVGSVFELVNNMPWWVWLIVAILALLVLVIVFKILSLFFPIFADILSGIWFVISLPFRGIKALVNKIWGE